MPVVYHPSKYHPDPIVPFVAGSYFNPYVALSEKDLSRYIYVYGLRAWVIYDGTEFPEASGIVAKIPSEVVTPDLPRRGGNQIFLKI